MKSFQTMRREGKGFFRIISYVVIATFIIGIFIVGSLSGMLGQETVSFITVEGREIVDRQLKDEVSKKLQGLENPTQKEWVLFQNVQPYINRMVFLLENRKQKLDPSLSALSEVLKSKYQELKTAYQKEMNLEYPYSYVDFLELNKEGYMTELLYSHMNSVPVVDELSVRKEYVLKNTTAQVEFAVFHFQDYLKTLSVPKEKIQQAYEANKDLFLESVTVKMTSFATLGEAEEALKKARAGNSADLSSAQEKTFKAGELDEFFKLKAAGAGNFSDVIAYQNRFWVTQVLKMNTLPLEKLTDKEIAKLKEQALETGRNEFFNEFKTAATGFFEKTSGSLKEVAEKNRAIYGMTAPIALTSDEAAKDEKTGKPMENIFTPDNKEFFKNAFAPEGTLSPVLVFGDNVYRIQVKKITRAALPIPEKTKEEIRKSLKEREQKKLEQEYITYLRSLYEVKYHWENVNSLFGIREAQ